MNPAKFPQVTNAHIFSNPGSPSSDSDIQEFFAGSTVLLTGATGFLGCLALEKLLRACPGIKRIYALVRPKKGVRDSERFASIFESCVFDLVRRERPGVFRKVVMLSGDCSLPHNGLSEKDLGVIREEVDCVFHFAATVRFDQKLRTAAFINVRSIVDLVALAKEMKKLKVFVHCSTAYSFSPRTTIDEEIYNTKLTGNQLLQLVTALDDTIADEITPTLIGKHPNTYTFTKAIAERYVLENRDALPIAIVRPSIVLSTYREPIRGWINNFYGPVGISIATGLGLLRTINGNFQNKADMVPADYVTNVMIAAAWEVGSSPRTEEEDELRVYNFVSNPENPITWRQYSDKVFALSIKYIPCLSIWYPMLVDEPNKALYNCYLLFLQRIPAFLADLVLRSIGMKPVLVEGNKKIEKFAEVISYFTSREWKYSNENTRALWEKLKPVDQKVFKFSMAEFDWADYLDYYTRGIRIYMLRDPLETLPAARAKHLRLKVAHYSVVFVFSCLLIYFLYSFVSHVLY